MMMRLFFCFLFSLCCHLPVADGQLSHVNPFIGTGGHGHTYPGATAPFGMVQLSPDTRIDMMDWDGCSGYHYSDSLIYGFSHTHLSGTGVADYCDLLLMPFTGGAELEPAAYASKFKKSKEKAEAGYYSVFLEKDKIRAELTATERVGVHRYTFPPNRERGHILVDLRHRDEVLDSYLKRVNDHEIEGYRISKAWAKEQHLYFVIRFSRPFSTSKILDMSKDPREASPSVTGKAIVGLLDFYNNNEPLVITVGISGTSIEGARKNLEAECSHFDFEKVKTATQAKWQSQLSKIKVEGGTEDQKTIFYSALYHTMVVPNIWNDVDGQYRGRDNKIHPSPGHDVYTVFSLWDTHRALHPLLTLLEPERTRDFINTFLLQYRQGGLLPVWELAANETDCMIGNHAIPVILDAYEKGIRGFDATLALEAMRASVESDRYGLRWYRELGYVPADKEPESVSKTLEYAYDDWCVAMMASKLNDTPAFTKYLNRSRSYRNLYDPATRFFRAKNNGLWHTPFDPYEVNFNYTEANAWQYRFSVQQDLWDLSSLFGGIKAFENQLDSLFIAKTQTSGRNQADITGQIGQYVHGNEPSHHIAYLYNLTNSPWKTHRRVRQIMDEQYRNAPDGLSGNEDCGQMSAWLVWSAMGLYPVVVPGSAYYLTGTPWFEKITLQPGVEQSSCTIYAPGVSAQKFYVEKIGVDSPGDYWEEAISHQKILTAQSLHFTMTEKPEVNAPLLTDNKILGWEPIPLPFVAKGARNFSKQQTIELGCLDPKASIYYTLDGADPTRNGQPYTGSFSLENAVTLKFFARSDRGQSQIATAQFYKTPDHLRLHRYNTRYSPQYTAGGDNGLIDGIRGGADFRTGDWQGFEGVNLDVVLDLGERKKINRVTAGFLQDENAWVFFPQKVQVEISDDGTNFSPAGELVCDVAPAEKGVFQKDFALPLNGNKARYVRITGVSPGKCPAGHKGAGFPCWVFADEISVE